MSQKQFGFAAIETTLILVVLAIVGFTGYYVWHSQQQTSKALDVANDTAQSAAPKKTANSTLAQKYLIIKEWGIKIPLSSDLRGAYYTYNSESKAVYLSNDSYKGTDCAADDVSLGAISRFTAADKDDEGNTLLAYSPDAVKIGDYYYSYQHPQAACDGRTTNSLTGFDDAGEAKSSKLMNEFKDASLHIVAAD